MLELLERVGLKGSYQVHCFPTILQPDQRAHQIFTGFSSADQIKAKLSPLYFEGTPVHVLFEGKRSAFRLDEEWVWMEGASLVVPAVQSDHPGGFYGLVWVMDKLLGPGGCPWDQEQTHSSLKRHLIEESYELLDAIDAEDQEGMIEELGDVLLQPVFHSQMEPWTIEAPIRAITNKLIRRHPHVFGEVAVKSSDEVLTNWDKIKAAEKGGAPASVLAGVPKALPALLRAYEVSKRAARCGFEWPNIDAVWDKVREEEAEFKEALASGDQDAAADELGDWLFTLVNIARWAKIEPEDALRRMVDRFTGRFQHMESLSPVPLDQLSADEWDALWLKAKSAAG